jgi:hypothetical protein
MDDDVCDFDVTYPSRLLNSDRNNWIPQVSDSTQRSCVKI